MESLSESTNDKEGFFKYVFNFDEQNVNSMLNLFQYSFISVPFIIMILKVLNYYTPEEDDSKGTLEVLAEIVGSISLVLLSIWFINRIIRYIPTYSKTDYLPFNEINFILPLFIVLFTMQTKLGAKINILVERLVDLYEGKTNLKESAKKKDYKTTQPISQAPGHQTSQADFLNQPQMQNVRGHMDSQQQQQPNLNSNNMYQGSTNPLVNAAQPMANSFEPMAANEGMGSMFGGGGMTPF